jgi:hypothetical protein
MTLLNKLQYSLIITSMGLLPTGVFAKPVTVNNLIENLLPGEPWDIGLLMSPKTVSFNQTASGGTDATVITKMTFSYFTSTNCTGTGVGNTLPGANPVPSYTTPAVPPATAFPISLGTPFGLVATSAWDVGTNQLGITNMTAIQSIAVTFKSTNSNTPQSNFSGSSFVCIPVTCTAGPSGTCTSGLGTQNFTLKTTAVVGDPADGGIIACMGGGLNNLVAASTDIPAMQWGGQGTTTGAVSTTDGSTNTTTIVNCLTGPGGGAGCPMNIAVNTYAAGGCKTLTAAGGYTTAWFLPAQSQLNCLFTNRASIPNLTTSGYWTSTEQSSVGAFQQSFANGSVNGSFKSSTPDIRCVRSVTF